MKKFWNWKTIQNNKDEPSESVLFLNGTIAEESWFDDDVTPMIFKEELNQHQGDITVWINSPGGDCIAAAQIYNLLMEHKGNVTVKIDGIAASAASVIAMAGTTVLIEMLNEVKESIINAYELKTGLSRNKLSKLMDNETWMDARKAVELGFADSMVERQLTDLKPPNISTMYSEAVLTNSLMEKLKKDWEKQTKPNNKQVSADSLLERLFLLKK